MASCKSKTKIMISMVFRELFLLFLIKKKKKKAFLTRTPSLFPHAHQFSFPDIYTHVLSRHSYQCPIIILPPPVKCEAFSVCLWGCVCVHMHIRLIYAAEPQSSRNRESIRAGKITVARCVPQTYHINLIRGKKIIYI